MRAYLSVWFTILCAGCAAVAPTAPPASAILAQEAGRVSFPGEGGVTLVGHLNLPGARFEGKRPAIVFQHGCGGPGANGKLSARHQAAMDWAVVRGFVALHVDSLSPRGEKELCTQKFSARKINQTHRVADAYSALEFLASHPAVDSTRIALWGWSHGGSSVLGAMRAPAPSSARARFAAAIAFYPGCSAYAQASRPYRPLNPTLILIGEADDWTPAAPCKALAEAMTQAKQPLFIELYAGAYHGFDDPNPNAKVRVRSDVPNGVKPGAGVTVGPHPEARTRAMKRAEQFLSTHLRF